MHLSFCNKIVHTSSLQKNEIMKNCNILFTCLAFLLTTIACKKEEQQPESFDLKNYVVHHIYRESDGAGNNYKAPEQLLLSFLNAKTDITHVGTVYSAPLPSNKSTFTVKDPQYSPTDSLLVNIDTTTRKVTVKSKTNASSRPVIASNLIDVREKNWDLNNLKLAGKLETRNSAGVLLQNPTTYVFFNSDATKLIMQETLPSGNITYNNTIYFGKDTNYYREANRGDATFLERLFFVFLKDKVIISGFYADYITHNTFYYYGELNKL